MTCLYIIERAVLSAAKAGVGMYSLQFLGGSIVFSKSRDTYEFLGIWGGNRMFLNGVIGVRVDFRFECLPAMDLTLFVFVI